MFKFLILNLIQVARLHFQELVHRDVGTEGGDDESEEENGTTGDGEFLPSEHIEQLWLMHRPRIETSAQESVGYQCRDKAHQHRTGQEQACG